jgi:bifunctional non-homologous end joining protein LigD
VERQGARRGNKGVGLARPTTRAGAEVSVALEEYRARRDFTRTPEPSGSPPDARVTKAAGGARSEKRLLYAIQKHAARRLHYDLRLELDGVLLSWAVPKGPSLDPRDRRLAARVEDHPLEYGEFEGTIPEGEYGAGTVELWDRGSWEPEIDPHEGLEKGDLKFTLHGEKLQGSWVLVRMKPRARHEDKEEWLLIKHRDEHAVDGEGEGLLDQLPRSVSSGRTLEEIAAQAKGSVWHGDRPADRQEDVHPGEEFRLDPSRVKGAKKAAVLPRFVRPELATLVERPPAGADWLHEVKFDGYRLISRIEMGAARLYTRREQDWTARYPLVVEDLSRLPVAGAMLDGEVVVQMPDGTTSFGALQGAGHQDWQEEGGQLVYYVFDLLYVNGYDLRDAGVLDRKELLRRLLAGNSAGSRILFSEYVSGEGEGENLFRHACRFGLEGVISKAAHSHYRPGARGNDWQKSKCRRQQEFVIGGYTEPTATRAGFGALLLGVYETDGLRYVGKVGSGFDGLAKTLLGQRLSEIEVESSPFTQDLPEGQRSVHWVTPELVSAVAFSEWTQDGHIRHPSFKGLREDKPAREVMAERPSNDPGAENEAAEVSVTHPDRVFWPATGQTKRDLIAYYEKVADWMLPHVVGRPIAMLRCPEGVEDPVSEGGRPCFFHKHPGPDFPGPFQRVEVVESGGPTEYLTVIEARSLTALAQMGVLEIHVWGSTWPDIEHPDMVVFDLDPDSALPWHAVADGSRLVRDTLGALGLDSFVKTTGGKGLHVVAPILPSETWQVVHDLARAVAGAVVAQAPDRYTDNMSKAKRQGKIFIDYVRNNRGSTSIAPYSSRARERATVAVPLRWSELSGRIRPDTYTIADLPARLRRLKSDPWESYFDVRKRQSISPHIIEVLKSHSGRS